MANPPTFTIGSDPIIDITGTNSVSDGKLSSWTSSKTIKLQVSSYASTYAARLHANRNGEIPTNSSDSNTLIKPRMKITAIGQSDISVLRDWSGNSSDIYYNTGNVGIGTTGPSSKLHVYGNQSVYLQGSTRPCIFYYKGATSGGDLKWVVGMNENPAENYSITGYNSAGHILLNPTGNVGIGTTSPSSKLHVLSPTGGYAFQVEQLHSGGDFRLTFNNDELNVYRKSGGSYSATGMYLNYNGGNVIVPSLTQSSDNKIKHNEKPIENALEIIDKLKPQTYFKSTKVYSENHNYELDSNGNPITNDNYQIETGFIAQDIQQIPELSSNVTSPKNDILSLNYNGIFVYNIKATQELHKKYIALESFVQTLEIEVTTQQQEIETLKLFNIDSNNQINELKQENQQLKQEIQTIKQHLGL